jgi:hypothetical protein
MANTAVRQKRYPSMPPATVTIRDRMAMPDTIFINPGGAVQFDNKDESDYRVRLWARRSDKHADVDILLPGFASVTFIVDPGVKKGECRYQFFETNLVNLNLKNEKVPGGKPGTPGGQTAAAGRIVIGPNPSPK